MTLEAFNDLIPETAEQTLLRCCGSTTWAKGVNEGRPFRTVPALEEWSDSVWEGTEEGDWREAFSHHPRIGEKGLREKWANQEQAGAAGATEEELQGLARGNREYEEKFGFIFLICATGKSAGEMLAALETRLGNELKAELRVAAAELNKITRIRLEKLFND